MNDDDISAYVDAASALLDLPIPEAIRAETLNAFKVMQTLSMGFLDFPLPEETEAAPRFTP